MKITRTKIVWAAALLIGQMFAWSVDESAVGEEYLSQYEQPEEYGQDEQMNEEMPQYEGEEGGYDQYGGDSSEYQQQEEEPPYQEDNPGEYDQYREEDQYRDQKDELMNDAEPWQTGGEPYYEDERQIDVDGQEQQYEDSSMQEEIPGQ